MNVRGLEDLNLVESLDCDGSQALDRQMTLLVPQTWLDDDLGLMPQPDVKPSMPL